MPTHNELRDYVQRVKQVDPDGHKWMVDRARTAVAAGAKAQTLVDHPGWSMFVTELEARRDAALTARAAFVEQLTRINTLGDEVATLKFKIKELDGGVAALNAVLGIVPGLVKAAAEAASRLE